MHCLASLLSLVYFSTTFLFDFIDAEHLKGFLIEFHRISLQRNVKSLKLIKLNQKSESKIFKDLQSYIPNSLAKSREYWECRFPLKLTNFIWSDLLEFRFSANACTMNAYLSNDVKIHIINSVYLSFSLFRFLSLSLPLFFFLYAQTHEIPSKLSFNSMKYFFFVFFPSKMAR